MQRITELIKKVNPKGILICLCILYVIAWILNGLKGLRFDLPEMRSTIATVGAYLGFTHGTDSLLNSPKGSSPGVPKGRGED